jgi:hypothetical protein
MAEFSRRIAMAFLEPPGPPLKYSTTFAVDAMFYSAARRARERAERAETGIRGARKKVFVCQMKMDRVKAKADEDEYGRTFYDEFEPLAIQMENLESGVVEAHGPVLRELAQAHILCAAALEAHINIRAEGLLPKRAWMAFERMGIDAKWLFLPRMQGLVGFDVGAQPFQGFDALISIRNKLVHWKVHREPYHGFEEPDSFAQRLSITFEKVDASLAAASGMVSELSKQLGEDRPPWWLDSEFAHFFEVHEEGGKG